MNLRRSDGLPQATASAASFVAYVEHRLHKGLVDGTSVLCPSTPPPLPARWPGRCSPPASPDPTRKPGSWEPPFRSCGLRRGGNARARPAAGATSPRPTPGLLDHHNATAPEAQARGHAGDRDDRHDAIDE